MGSKKKFIKRNAAKILLAGVLSFGTSSVFAQAPPPPPTPPPPGGLLQKMNPFKKKKDAKPVKKDSDLVAPANPQAPPDPIDVIRKKKLPKPPPHPALPTGN